MLRWVRGEIAGLSLRQMRSLAAGMVLAVAGLFGGLDTVDPGPGTFTTGEPHSDGQFTVTVARATVVDELRAGRRLLGPAVPGSTYLGVVATVRNDGTVPGKLPGEFELRDLPQNTAVGVFRVADGSPILTLGPGLTEKLAFVWRAPTSALHPGVEVTLRIWQKRFTELLVNYGIGWLASPTEYAQIVLPVAAA